MLACAKGCGQRRQNSWACPHEIRFGESVVCALVFGRSSAVVRKRSDSATCEEIKLHDSRVGGEMVDRCGRPRSEARHLL